jgi:hypothetical protein
MESGPQGNWLQNESRLHYDLTPYGSANLQIGLNCHFPARVRDGLEYCLLALSE